MVISFAKVVILKNRVVRNVRVDHLYLGAESAEPICPKDKVFIKGHSYQLLWYRCVPLIESNEHDVPQPCSKPECDHRFLSYKARIVALGESIEDLEEEAKKKRIVYLPRHLKSSSENEGKDSQRARQRSRNKPRANRNQGPHCGRKDKQVSAMEETSDVECPSKYPAMQQILQIKQEQAEKISQTATLRAQDQLSKYEKQSSPQKLLTNFSPRRHKRVVAPKSLKSEAPRHPGSPERIPINKKRRVENGNRKSQMPPGYNSKEVGLLLAEKDTILDEQTNEITELQAEIARMRKKMDQMLAMQPTSQAASDLQNDEIVDDADHTNETTIVERQEDSNNTADRTATSREDFLSRKKKVEKAVRGYKDLEPGQTSRPRKRTWALIADSNMHFRNPFGDGYAEHEERYKVKDGDIFISNTLSITKYDWKLIKAMPSPYAALEYLTLIVFAKEPFANQTIEPEAVKEKDYIPGQGPVQQLPYEKLRLLMSVFEELFDLAPKNSKLRKLDKMLYLPKVPSLVTAHSRRLRRELQKKIAQKGTSSSTLTNPIDV